MSSTIPLPPCEQLALGPASRPPFPHRLGRQRRVYLYASAELSTNQSLNHSHSSISVLLPALSLSFALYWPSLPCTSPHGLLPCTSPHDQLPPGPSPLICAPQAQNSFGLLLLLLLLLHFRLHGLLEEIVTHVPFVCATETPPPPDTHTHVGYTGRNVANKFSPAHASETGYLQHSAWCRRRVEGGGWLVEGGELWCILPLLILRPNARTRSHTHTHTHGAYFHCCSGRVQSKRGKSRAT